MRAGFLRRLIRATPAWLLVPVLLLPGTPASAVEIVKSPGDHRQFGYLELPNGLRAVLVSDPDTDKAAASLSVAVGSSSDPDDRLGLAHFLEHMLFLGTEKYPHAGEYDEFINAHGGSQNAYTAFENTNYHFDIDRAFLEAGLDRFSQFFISPLFTADYVQREKNAVHSEFKARIQDDDRRGYAAMQQVVNPAHPLSRFSVGNLDTLSDRHQDGIRDQLVSFYRQHYSSNLMTLAVLGREPLPVLEKWVRRYFSGIENRHLHEKHIDAPMFAPGTLPMRLDVEPLREQRTLELVFPIPAIEAHYRSKPVDYIANLLGHEGPGSLLSLLKARGWAEGLGAGLARADSDGAAFNVTVSLTPTGLLNVDSIAELVFSTLRSIRRDGVARWRFDEQSRLAQLAFQFDQKDVPLSTVTALAETMPHVAPADILQAGFIMRDYEPETIRRYLDELRPDNMLMVVTARGVKTTRRAPWYDTAFEARPLAPTLVAALERPRRDDDLQLPEPNPFIPSDTALKPLAAGAPNTPVRIVERPGFELWFKQDGDFAQPRADFFFSVRSPVANDSPEDAVLASLYTQLVGEQLNEFSYAAQLAGLSFAVYPHIRGFTVRISGYNDKLPLLLSRIVDTLAHPVIEKAAFEQERQALIRALDNRRHDDPYEQTVGEVGQLLLRPSWSEARRIAAARATSPSALRDYVPRLLHQIEIVALAHGNLRQTDAEALATPLIDKLLSKAEPVNVDAGQIVQLEAGKRYVRELGLDHPDSAITVYFQGTDRSAAERARFELLAQILEAPFYNQLRTEKQLGYVVNVGSLPMLDVPGLSFLIQSPTSAPLALEGEIDDFLRRFETVVTAMPQALFDEHKAGLLSRIRNRDERLRQRSDRFWNELDLGHLHFDFREQLADAVSSLTRPDIVEAYRRILLDGRARRMVISTAGAAAAEGPASRDDATVVRITDPDAFSTGRTLTPAPVRPNTASGTPAALPGPRSAAG